MSDLFRRSTVIPWFMYDISNRQIITSPTIPGDITDSKDVLFTEVPIPGKNFSPIRQGGNGNRKISFTLPLINRNNPLGNSLILKQFDQLRNQYIAPGETIPQQFNPNPRVLYYWGIGSVPLIYRVKNVRFVHKSRWANVGAFPQYSDAQIELWLDEENPLYRAEEAFRRVSAVLSQAASIGGEITGRIF